MLYLRAKNRYRLTDADNCIEYPSIVFRRHYDLSWFETDFARRLLSEIDHFEFPADKSVAQVFAEQGRKPYEICNGSRNNMLARFYETDERIITIMMGPNCYKFLCETAREKDVYAMSCSVFCPTDDDMQGLVVVLEDIGVTCRNAEELRVGMIGLMAEEYFSYEKV